jgi:hypothetical protein
MLNVIEVELATVPRFGSTGVYCGAEAEVVAELQAVHVPRRDGREQVTDVDDVTHAVQVKVVEAVEVAR